LVRRLGRPITSDLVCGDAKHNFTPRGIRMLLECTGFRIELLTGKESGKKLPTLRAFFLHHSLYWLSLITRRPVALGMVIVARPAMALESPTNKEGAESAP
jgi:hypothetical protein